MFVSCSSGDDDSGGGNVTPPQSGDKCPTFSPIGGFYKTAQTVTISCEDEGDIYYKILEPTLDDDGNWDEAAWKVAVRASKPDENATKYTEPFSVNKQCIIRSCVVKGDGKKNYAMTAFDFDLDRSTDATSQTPTNPFSDKWEDQTIYFILTDRFNNGEKSNDKIQGLKKQDGTAYDESVVLSGQPTSGYNGGDIKGITQKLDYIKNLGFTAIWMTPPVKCQVAEENYHGFHGYWASDFTKVDSHMGTLEDYKELVEEAHKKGLYIIHDIVVNHVGDYQKIGKDVTKEMVANPDTITTAQFRLEDKSVPFDHPEQLPWALNNIKDLTVDEWQNNAFYNYNTNILDFNASADYRQVHQSSDLDDLKTTNPVVRNLLRGYFRYWIDKTGLDGYRIDTAMYVEPDFFEGFINDTDTNNMGVRAYGLSKGKTDFIDFGEAFSPDENLVGEYTKSKSGTPRMDSMFYFPLRDTIAATIGSGSATKAITDVLTNRQTKSTYLNPGRLVTFIDNHDMDRWGKIMNGNDELLKAAYTIMYTVPGVPQVYYGSEQGFAGESRAGMFKGSFLEPGQTQTADKFDSTNKWYKYFQTLNKMRQEHRVFRYNSLYSLQSTTDSAGVLAYIVRETDPTDSKKTLSGVGNKALFVMNTAANDKILDASYGNIAIGDEFTLIDDVGDGKTAGSKYADISVARAGTAITKKITATQDGTKGNLKLIVPANSVAVYILTTAGTGSSSSVDGADLQIKTIGTSQEISGGKVSGNAITITGQSDATGTVKIVLNGDYTQAESVSATVNQEFSKAIDITAYSNGKTTVQLVQTVGDETHYSQQLSFTIERPYKLILKVTDPLGDDNGVGAAKGKLHIPDQETQFQGCMDIAGVDVYKSGNDLRLGVKMNSICHSWNPGANAFDHVVFFIFVSDRDDITGCNAIPKMNYTLPSTFGKWDYMFQCNGWGQAFYNSNGADANTYGQAAVPAPKNEPVVDWAHITEDPTITAWADLDWTSYDATVHVGDNFQDKPGMIWFTISAASLGFAKDISGYKIHVVTWDYDMGNIRGFEEKTTSGGWKFATELTAAQTPMVCDETDNVIVIP